jgi:hypothetical protein
MEVSTLSVYTHSEDEILKCPQCGFSSLHLISVSVHRKTDKTTVSNEGITIKEEENKTRGVIVALEYQCENYGHHGIIVYQFHKGLVYIEHETLAPVGMTDLKDIWRD